MKRTVLAAALGWLVILSSSPAVRAEEPEYTRTRDVIYGRKFGLAMTMDVFTPKKANGRGLIWVVSGGWFSRSEAISPVFAAPFLKRGYTVFAVIHGSQPKFTVLEIVDDMHRAVRFIRANAERFKVDPEQLGIFGASAGGHLSLMQGTAGTKGDPKAKDPVERHSSRVRAVACFFPPTDFLNYGAKGKELIDRALRPPFTAAVDYHEYDGKKALYIPITDPRRLREIARQISPIYHVTAESAPTLIIHGDKDELVPLQQSEIMVEKLKEANVPVELIVRKGSKHGWPTLLLDLDRFADWFDKHLKPAKVEKLTP
jgi:acetyl esterase/lipase